jgi:hypothetical protein
MSIEDGGPQDFLLEAADEDEVCPICDADNWLRAVAIYKRGACWIIYCGDCGRTIEERWNILP